MALEGLILEYKISIEWAWLARNVLATMNVLVPEQTVFTYASS